MPTKRDARSIAAGAQVNNLLDGSLFEIIQRSGRLVVAAVTDNAADEVLMQVLIDTSTVLEESPVALEPAAGQGPTLEDHAVILEGVGPGDKITIRVRNTAGVAAALRTLISVP